MRMSRRAVVLAFASVYMWRLYSVAFGGAGSACGTGIAKAIMGLAGGSVLTGFILGITTFASPCVLGLYAVLVQHRNLLGRALLGFVLVLLPGVFLASLIPADYFCLTVAPLILFAALATTYVPSYVPLFGGLLAIRVIPIVSFALVVGLVPIVAFLAGFMMPILAITALKVNLETKYLIPVLVALSFAAVLY